MDCQYCQDGTCRDCQDYARLEDGESLAPPAVKLGAVLVETFDTRRLPCIPIKEMWAKTKLVC